MNILSTQTDLRQDVEAAEFYKVETVHVKFASADGSLMSRVGPNHYQSGDAIIHAADGEIWAVSRARFDAKYLPMPSIKAGENGDYQAKKMIVLAKQMCSEFSIARTAGGDVLEGAAGDWLMQYAPGDFGIVARARFERIYRPATQS
jgi:PGDYG protein